MFQVVSVRGMGARREGLAVEGRERPEGERERERREEKKSGEREGGKKKETEKMTTRACLRSASEPPLRARSARIPSM